MLELSSVLNLRMLWNLLMVKIKLHSGIRYNAISHEFKANWSTAHVRVTIRKHSTDKVMYCCAQWLANHVFPLGLRVQNSLSHCRWLHRTKLLQIMRSTYPTPLSNPIISFHSMIQIQVNSLFSPVLSLRILSLDSNKLPYFELF